jgi:hypothetical protein
MNTQPPACPVCSTPAPHDPTLDNPWLCSMACFRAYWNIPEPQPEPMPHVPPLTTTRPPQEVTTTNWN